MQIQTNGNRNITLDFDAPKKFKLSQNGVEVPFIRTGKNSLRLSKKIDGILDLEEIQEAPKSIVRPMKLQAQQMALVNPNDVIAINQAAQQLEIEQNILSENQKRLEYAQDYIDIQQQKINQAVESVGMLETDNKERLDKAESSIFNLAGKIAKTGEQSINAIISVDEKINQHENAENPHKITKKTIKLDKVDNTSDLDKPVSKAVQAELDKKADKEELESIKEEISNYQEKTDRFNDALSNYTGGIGGTELPSGGFTGQLLSKKTDLTGDYEWVSPDLDVGDGVLTIQKNGTDIDSFSANAKTDKTINITVPTQASDIDALPDSTKYGSSLALSIDSSTYIITAQLKDQDGNNLGSSQTIDLPLESVVVNGSYDSENKKIVLTLENGNTIEIPVGDLISGLQTEITSENKLNADLVDDSTSTNKFVTANDKTTWNSKQDTLTAGTGIDITSDVISNSGVRAVSTGATNGTISVNTNGTSAEVSVYGLGSAAYTSSSDYDTSGSASTAETNAKNYADSLASNYATSAQGALADTALQSGDNISELVNDSGYLTGISSSDVTTALGYTPYDSSNPDSYQTASDVATAISGKQDTLISGTNIKTINGSSVLGSGDLSVTAQAAWGSITGTLSNQADLQNALNAKQGTLTFDSTPTSGSSNPVTSGGIYTALSAKANDSAVVKLTGNQSIDGVKTYLNALHFKNGGTYSDTPASNQMFALQHFKDSTGKYTGMIDNYTRTNGSTHTRLVAYLPTDNSKYCVIDATVDKNGNASTYAPTPTTTDNSTNIATTAFVRNVLETIYPVGSCYIGTGSTCPIAALFGTWTLKSTGIVTSVDSNVPVKGNGKALCITNGNTEYSLGNDTGTANGRHTALYLNYANTDLPSNSSNATISATYSNALFGVTTDATKSGLVGTVTRSTLSVNIWERTA